MSHGRSEPQPICPVGRDDPHPGRRAAGSRHPTIVHLQRRRTPRRRCRSRQPSRSARDGSTPYAPRTARSRQCRVRCRPRAVVAIASPQTGARSTPTVDPAETWRRSRGWFYPTQPSPTEPRTGSTPAVSILTSKDSPVSHARAATSNEPFLETPPRRSRTNEKDGRCRLQSNSAEVSAHASAMHDRLPRELSSKAFHMPSTAR